MSVYLKDGLVLLHSDLIATDAACCCNTGMCCLPGASCADNTTEAGCLALDPCGVFIPGSNCTHDFGSCPQGTCCSNPFNFYETCDFEFEADCCHIGGRFHESAMLECFTFCFGACCTGRGNCNQHSAEGCANAGGTFLGYGVPCSPNPC